MTQKPLYITIHTEEVIAAIMVIKNKREVSFKDYSNAVKKLDAAMRQKGINGGVEYSMDHMREFAYRNKQKLFLGESSIQLQSGCDIDWVRENILAYCDVEKIKLFFEVLDKQQKQQTNVSKKKK